MHAHAEVAAGDGAQQPGQLAQVAVHRRHQLVEALEHDAEIVLVRAEIGTRAEVAGRGGLGQMPDVAAERAEVGLDRIHRLGDRGLLAGQARHVLAEIADGVAPHQRHHRLRGAHVQVDQRIGVTQQLTVVAREGGRIAAAGDGAVRMSLRHPPLLGQHRAQLGLHGLHAAQQLGGLVVALCRQHRVELAGGDRRGHAGAFAQRPHQALGDAPAQPRTDRQQQAAAEQQQPARAGHGGHRLRIGAVAERAQVRGVALDRLLPLRQQRLQGVQVQGLRIQVLVVGGHRQHLRLERLHLHIGLVDRRAQLRAGAVGRVQAQREQLAPCLRVVALGLADRAHHRLLLVGVGQDDVVEQADLQPRLRRDHGVGQADLLHLVQGDVVELLARQRHRREAGHDQGAADQQQGSEGEGQAWADPVAAKEADHGSAASGGKVRATLCAEVFRTATARRQHVEL
ncbi:hypothetical protein NB706_002376 [Xanthomonas sacchari]|nr:hypothetical protein [Xanthomonas sacchari]